MRILITGGTGFLGRAITRDLLAHGHTVTALSRGKTAAALDPGVLAVNVDLLDASATARVVAENPADAVIHLAARTNARESFADPVGYFTTNVTGTINLLQALNVVSTPEHRPRVVFASTHAVYGSRREGRVSESHPVSPESPYAASKVASEQLLTFHAQTARIGAVILRCFNVAGALEGVTDSDRNRILPRIIDAARTGEPLTINGDGSSQRDFVHIADVAAAFRLAAESVEAGLSLVCNIGTGVGTSIADLISAAELAMNATVPVVHGPHVDEPRTVVADVGRAHVRLRWAPSVRSDIATIAHDSVAP